MLQNYYSFVKNYILLITKLGQGVRSERTLPLLPYDTPNLVS